jgi:hypothetical protein
MKKLLIALSVSLLSLISFARVPEPNNYMTKEGRLNCKKITLGMNNARIIFENGSKATLPLNTISSYTLNSKVYTKLPLYKNGEPTNKMAFMELIKTVGELSLYKLEQPDNGSTLMDAKIYSYFLYNGDKMHLALDEKTLPNICKNFGITYYYQ